MLTFPWSLITPSLLGYVRACSNGDRTPTSFASTLASLALPPRAWLDGIVESPRTCSWPLSLEHGCVADRHVSSCLATGWYLCGSILRDVLHRSRTASPPRKQCSTCSPISCILLVGGMSDHFGIDQINACVR